MDGMGMGAVLTTASRLTKGEKIELVLVVAKLQLYYLHIFYKY
jgi:hypothetical protein